MGWCSGSEVIIPTWGAVREHVEENERPWVLAQVIRAFEAHDWDCQDDIRGQWPEAEKALYIVHPDWKE